MSGDNITVSSTTDDQSAVDQAADYNPEAPAAERPHVTITSETDSTAEVEQARYSDRDDEPHARDGRFTQQAAEKPLPVQSTTDPEEVVRAESEKLREHQEDTGTDYATGLPKGMGLTRRQREATISRLLAKNESLDKENEQLRSQLGQRGPQDLSAPYSQTPPQQPQPDAWQQAHARQYTSQEKQSAVEAYRQAQARIAEEEKVFVERHPDYIESVRRLEPGHETPIPPTSYYHLMLNVPNAPDVGYYLSRHPETIAKLWSLETSGQGIRVMEELNHISSGLRFQANAAQTGAASAAHRERQTSSGPPAPIRPVGGSSVNSSNGGYSESMSMRDYNLWRDSGGGGGRGRR